MWAFVLRRIVALIPVALLVVFITFILIHLVPGNPAYTILGETASKSSVKLLDEKLGLNQPLATQFVQYLWHVVHGNLGTSLVYGESVSSLIVSRLPVTVELSILVVFFALMLAIPLGVAAAVRANTWVDSGARLLALAGAAVPNFWLALVLVLVFSVTWRLLPTLGWSPLSQGIGPNLVHLILPMAVLVPQLIAVISRVLRGEMLEVLHNLYVQVARSKGLKESRVIWKHALRNAVIPVVTVVGLQIGGLLGGVVITESIFSLPGMGELVYTAIYQRDYPVLQGCVLFFALVVLLANLAVDVVYALIDPRIQYS
jgi:peptide/nickel transport system permease protein